jgi:hypothetical protein
VTWERLIELESRLLALYNRALAIRKGKHRFNALDVWIGRGRGGGMKDDLMALVGWNRKPHPELGTDEAYNLAYDKLFYETLLGEPRNTDQRNEDRRGDGEA